MYSTGKDILHVRQGQNFEGGWKYRIGGLGGGVIPFEERA